MFQFLFRGLTIALFGCILWAEWWFWGRLCGWVATWPLLFALMAKGLFVLFVCVPTVVEEVKCLLRIAANDARFASAKQAQAAYLRESEGHS